MLEGEDLGTTRLSFMNTTGEPHLQFSFNKGPADRWSHSYFINRVSYEVLRSNVCTHWLLVYYPGARVCDVGQH